MKRNKKSKKIRISVYEDNLDFCNNNNLGLSELLNTLIEEIKDEANKKPLGPEENIYSRTFSINFNNSQRK